MSDLNELCEQLSANIASIKPGALRFWGIWFGRPYDNQHRIVSVATHQDSLVFTFDEGETLTVVEPKGMRVNEREFRIQSASVVRWEWFYYGRPQEPTNRFFEEFTDNGSGISFSTNADWSAKDSRPDRRFAAVEMPRGAA